MQSSKIYGLIGFPLGHSFSKRYFTEKFERECIEGAQYELFALEDLSDLVALLDQKPNICGLNVTIPYKQAIIPYLNALSPAAREIGAVNCVHFGKDGQLTGHNTDVVGFGQSLCNFEGGNWAKPNTRAIVLGNGGAAKAVVYTLRHLGIGYQVVTRTPSPTNSLEMGWDALNAQLLQWTGEQGPFLIVNTTPIGMAPHQEDCPPLPFHLMDNRFLVFDLVYNPEETVLLQRTRVQGAKGLNGLEMLYLQADAAWAIWNNAPN